MKKKTITKKKTKTLVKRTRQLRSRTPKLAGSESDWVFSRPVIGPVAKLTAILIIIGLNWAGLSAIGTTFAFYNDTETSNDNSHIAGQLDFILNQSGWTPPGGELDLDSGESVSRDITIVDVDNKSIDFKYIVRPQMTGGDNDFCGALELEALLEGAPAYSGPLFDFISATTTFGPAGDDWTFNFSLPLAAPDFNNKSCSLDFVYSGWQIRFPNEGEGFYDVERASSTIESGAPKDPSVCPFETGAGRTVIKFDNYIRSDRGISDATNGPIFGYVPAGTYDITLVSYDKHSSKPGQVQPKEKWYLILKNLVGGTIATTNAISDLPDADDQRIEKVETGFTLVDDIFFATAFHDAYPDSNPNSITPICAAFDGPNAGVALAPPEDLIPPPGGRITDGLLALYTFEEDDESIVWDVSGVGSPLYLLIGDAGATSRVSGGLSIDSSTIVKELVPSTKIINGVQATEKLTIEAWVSPENTTQEGPARVVTYSKDTGVRNFTLGQGKFGGAPSNVFDARLRTTVTSLNGIPSLTSPTGTASTDLTHIVYTRDSSGTAKMFIDGVEVASTTVSGSVSNWNSGYKFALANELTMDRTWLGDYHLVAIYNKALSASEVEQNFKAGADRTIVLNEFLPNPTGDDGAAKPLGEWVELYNLSDTAIDVNGWYLYDSLDSHPLPITAGNSDNDGDTGDAGETIVPALGYLVVYLDGAYSGWLNNSGGDTVRLYNGPIGTGVLVDSHSYSGAAPENKSFARIPDGIGAFVDPIPTPLAPNKLADADLTQTDAESKLEDADDKTEDADGKIEDNPVKPEDEPIMPEDPEEPEDNEDGKLEDGDGGGDGGGGGGDDDMGVAGGGSDPTTVITGTDEQETASVEEIAIAPEQEELPFENEPTPDNQQPTTNDINESAEADDEPDDEAVESEVGSDPTVSSGQATDEAEEETALVQEELPFENEPTPDNQQPTTNDINESAADDDEMPQEVVESENELESDKAEEEPVQLIISEEPDPVKLPVTSETD